MPLITWYGKSYDQDVLDTGSQELYKTSRFKDQDSRLHAIQISTGYTRLLFKHYKGLFNTCQSWAKLCAMSLKQ